MHEIDGAGHVSNQFTEGTPGVQEATVVTDDWLNAVQNEIVNVIEGAGLTLTKVDNTQLLTAIRKLIPVRGEIYIETDGAGGCTVRDDWNLVGAANLSLLASGRIDFTFTTPFAVPPAIVGQVLASTSGHEAYVDYDTTVMQCGISTSAGAGINMATGVYTLVLIVSGRY